MNRVAVSAYLSKMTIVRSLAGLPPYGPAALSFPKPGAFKEGFIVEFTLENAQQWVGNFAVWNKHGGSVHSNLGERAIIVIAGGAGYIVDAVERTARTMSGIVEWIWFCEDQMTMIVSNGLWFEAFDAKSTLWRSQRVSWDSVRNVTPLDGFAVGEALNPMTGDWLPFRVNLASGDVEGGSYDGPER